MPTCGGLAPAVVVRRQGNPQDLREFFLDVHDHLGLAELLRQSSGLSRKPQVLGDQGGVGIGLPPTTLRGQSGQRSFLALLAPSGQVRRVQALAAQQGAELARLGTAIDLAKNAKLVLRRETSSHRLLRHRRVRDGLSVADGRSPRGRGGGRNGRNVSIGLRQLRYEISVVR